MMKVYGLRIGDVGIEFGDLQSREKALLTFTRGSTVKIVTSAGPRFRDHEGAFSTYERETNDQAMNCTECMSVFTSETCMKREVPEKRYDGSVSKYVYQDDGRMTDEILCDGCFAKKIREFEVFKAKQVMDASGS
jgi:hypothetical protein